jgi:hypothetical protein
MHPSFINIYMANDKTSLCMTVAVLNSVLWNLLKCVLLADLQTRRLFVSILCADTQTKNLPHGRPKPLDRQVDLLKRRGGKRGTEEHAVLLAEAFVGVEPAALGHERALPDASHEDLLFNLLV